MFLNVYQCSRWIKKHHKIIESRSVISHVENTHTQFIYVAQWRWSIIYMTVNIIHWHTFTCWNMGLDQYQLSPKIGEWWTSPWVDYSIHGMWTSRGTWFWPIAIWCGTRSRSGVVWAVSSSRWRRWVVKLVAMASKNWLLHVISRGPSTFLGSPHTNSGVTHQRWWNVMVTHGPPGTMALSSAALSRDGSSTIGCQGSMQAGFIDLRPFTGKPVFCWGDTCV